MNYNQSNKGVGWVLFAYIIWGLLPIYWKMLDEFSPGEVLAHRIIWSFLLMIILILLSGKKSIYFQEFKGILKDHRKFFGLFCASVIISLNWLTYIWAVNTGHVVETSLGYYINPLLSVLLGIFVLKEKVSNRQIIAIVLAGIGVLIITISLGSFPFIAFILAITFAIYGLLKKTVDVSAIFGLAIETLLVTPIAMIYLISIPSEVSSFSIETSYLPILLLIGTGIATAGPLLLFAQGAKTIPLTLLGFLQFVSPTILLVLGVFAYKEEFTFVHLISFAFIWIALFIYLSATFHRPIADIKGKQLKHS